MILCEEWSAMACDMKAFNKALIFGLAEFTSVRFVLPFFTHGKLRVHTLGVFGYIG